MPSVRHPGPDRASTSTRFWLGVLVTVCLTGCADPYVEGMAAYDASAWEVALENLAAVNTTHDHYIEARDLLPELRFRAGRTAYEDGRWPRALALLRDVREHEPRYAAAQDLIGCTFYRMGAEAFERGDYAEAQRLAGIVRSSCSHADEARVLVARARKRLQG